MERFKFKNRNFIYFDQQHRQESYTSETEVFNHETRTKATIKSGLVLFKVKA